ncbi:unnamed protein product [Bemisia tabaci]|uniref:Uncharacterized protein n=1 Tax=Bemisia tabaci TaxID=7038 RepID=A0A9P0A3Z4_BEMTA|nr:unnamed protein product [Bemisia tabaci]
MNAKEQLPTGTQAPDTPPEPYVPNMTHFDELLFLAEQIGGQKSTCSLELTDENGGGIDEAILQDEETHTDLQVHNLLEGNRFP